MGVQNTLYVFRECECECVCVHITAEQITQMRARTSTYTKTHNKYKDTHPLIASRSRNLIDSVFSADYASEKEKKRAHHYTGINLHLLIKFKFFTVSFPHPPPSTSSCSLHRISLHHFGFLCFVVVAFFFFY